MITLAANNSILLNLVILIAFAFALFKNVDSMKSESGSGEKSDSNSIDDDDLDDDDEEDDDVIIKFIKKIMLSIFFDYKYKILSLTRITISD